MSITCFRWVGTFTASSSASSSAFVGDGGGGESSSCPAPCAEEADKFNSLKEELAEQRAKLALVQLLYHKSELAGVRLALGVAQASCADVHASTIAPLQKERDDQTAKRKKMQTSTASAEKRLKAVAAEVAKLRPAKLQAKEQMARLDKLTKKK